VQLACDPEHAQAIGPVGRDLELEHISGDRQQLRQWRARAGHRTETVWSRVEHQLVEHHDPIAARADLQLVLGEDHPFGDDAAELRLLELRAVGHHRSRPRYRDSLPSGNVRRSAHDRRRPVRRLLADVDLAHAQPIRVRVWLHIDDAPDHEPVLPANAVMVDRLDLRPGHRQPLLDRAHVELRVAVFAQPVQRNAHQNCSRKRRSFS